MGSLTTKAATQYEDKYKQDYEEFLQSILPSKKLDMSSISEEERKILENEDKFLKQKYTIHNYPKDWKTSTK